MTWVYHVAHIVEVRKACNILVRNPEGKRRLQTPRSKREENA
jgi:hypothetical protein